MLVDSVYVSIKARVSKRVQAALGGGGQHVIDSRKFQDEGFMGKQEAPLSKLPSSLGNSVWCYLKVGIGKGFPS